MGGGDRGSVTAPYRVVLPVEIGERRYGFGAVVRLTAAEAVEHAASLIAVEDSDDGGNVERHHG